MTLATVLAVTAVWIAVGFVVLRWASEFASEESERERVRKENARRQAMLAEALEAARAELRSLEVDRRAFPASLSANGQGPSRPCLEQ